jgi:hypothetical protein
MANFVQYNLSGIAAPVYPTPAVTYSGVPVTQTYTTTSGIGYTLPDDYNGAISLQVTAIAGTSPTLVVEISNIDPQFYINSSAGGALGPGSIPPYGQQALFTDIAADNVWVAVNMTNVNTNASANTITAVGLYACQSLAYRNVRVRLSSGTGPTATVILGYGYLI